jgi:tryptophanyl-tRNA synthetase
LFAAGLSSEFCNVFVQSHVRAHSELTWLLTCMTPLGWLERMTQFKDKSKKQKHEEIGMGLLSYPILMAVDILIYHPNYVPVGEDQKQHVELTRDLAQRFNFRYGNIFTIPEATIPKIGARIMSIKDPSKKMSKSDDDPNSAIFLLDSPDEIREKFKHAKTDSLRSIEFDEKREAIFNLLSIYQSFTVLSQYVIQKEFDGKYYKYFKERLAEVVIEGLKPLQQNYKRLSSDWGLLDKMLADNAKRAAEIADATLLDVQKRMGIR